jgi:hypothetical protein
MRIAKSMAAVVAATVSVAAARAGTVTVSKGSGPNFNAFDGYATGCYASAQTSTAYGPATFTGCVKQAYPDVPAAQPLRDFTPFLYASGAAGYGPAASVKFTTSLNTIDIYWGSIDSLAGDGSDNILTLSNGDVVTGTDLVADIGALGVGSQTLPVDNQWVQISDTASFNGFTATSTTGTFFEFDMAGPGGAAVPEPSTWAMVLLGFTGLGFTGCHLTKAGLFAVRT